MQSSGEHSRLPDMAEQITQPKLDLEHQFDPFNLTFDPLPSPVESASSPAETGSASPAATASQFTMPPVSNLNSTINLFGENNYPPDTTNARNRVGHFLEKLNTLHAKGRANNRRDGNPYDMQGWHLIDATYEFLAMTTELRTITNTIAEYDTDPTSLDLNLKVVNVVGDTSPKLYALLPQAVQFILQMAAKINDLEYQAYFVQRVKENLYQTFVGIEEKLLALDRASEAFSPDPTLLTLKQLLNMSHEQAKVLLSIQDDAQITSGGSDQTEEAPN